MRVFLSELCLCCLFILPWEVLPLIVGGGVKTGSPLSLAQPLPICLNSDKDVHPLAGWKTVKNTNDAFEQVLPAVAALPGLDTHVVKPTDLVFLACHTFIVSVFEGHSHTPVDRDRDLRPCHLFLNVKNCRTPPLCIGTSKESWRQSSACHNYGDCLEVKTVRQNVQVKHISWYFKLCNLNIKFNSSDVIKKVGCYRSRLTLHPRLVLSVNTQNRDALSEPVVWQWPRGSQNSTLRFGLSGWRRDWNRFLKLNKSSSSNPPVFINTRTQNKKCAFHIGS